MLLTAALVSVAAYADMGPKPSVKVSFRGLEGETYYATLLSSDSRTGPHYAWNGNEEDIHFYNAADGRDIWEKFADYPDEDGYYYLQINWDCTESHSLDWNYYPPSEFKVLLYFPETDSFAVSKTFSRYAFDSYYRADYRDGELKVSMALGRHLGQEALAFLVRLTLTLVIELSIVLLFSVAQTKKYLVVIFVNIATQLGLNILLNIFWNSMLLIWIYLFLECIIIAVESYWYVQKEVFSKESHAVSFSVTANICSFIAGVFLSIFLPYTF